MMNFFLKVLLFFYSCVKIKLIKFLEEIMKAVITVVGHDTVGIVADVSAECAKSNANIIDITQKVVSDYFTMILLVEIDNLSVSFSDFSDMLALLAKKRNLEIRVMHEDIFNTMHRI